jgi:hypothetical protein
MDDPSHPYIFSVPIKKSLCTRHRDAYRAVPLCLGKNASTLSLITDEIPLLPTANRARISAIRFNKRLRGAFQKAIGLKPLSADGGSLWKAIAFLLLPINTLNVILFLQYYIQTKMLIH